MMIFRIRVAELSQPIFHDHLQKYLPVEPGGVAPWTEELVRYTYGVETGTDGWILTDHQRTGIWQILRAGWMRTNA